MTTQTIKAAIRDLQQGKLLILTDHPERENEGDLIIAAQSITTEIMNFIIRNTSGIVCVSLGAELIKKFQLPLMVPACENTSLRGTPFTVSIDAQQGITTGVSAADRVTTIHTLLSEQANAADIVRPGHIFPLQACAGGVLERPGHTEGALDLMKLAALKPAAILCEIMNKDGSMCRGKKLLQFARKHNIAMLSIDEIIAYRLQQENMIAEHATTTLPLDSYGTFKLTVMKEKFSTREHIVLTKKPHSSQKPLLVRIHSSCTTGDLFASKRCDCHKQLHHALQRISKEGGMLIYLNQEGRGIGLFNKIKAYALQENGYDTVEANKELGLPVDARQYYMAADILKFFGISAIRLLTSNPQKIQDLKKSGIKKVVVEPMPAFTDKFNQQYLTTKIKKMNHTLNMPSVLS